MMIRVQVMAGLFLGSVGFSQPQSGAPTPAAAAAAGAAARPSQGQGGAAAAAAVPATGPSQVKGDTVVAVMNGKNFTADQVRNFVSGTPPQAQALYAKDPKQFLRDHAYYLALVDYAEKNGIDKMDPYV